MPGDLKVSQIGSSQLPPPFRGLHPPGVRKHCQIIFACYFRKSSIRKDPSPWQIQGKELCYLGPAHSFALAIFEWLPLHPCLCRHWLPHVHIRIHQLTVHKENISDSTEQYLYLMGGRTFMIEQSTGLVCLWCQYKNHRACISGKKVGV